MTIRTNTGPAYRLQLVFDAGPTMSMWRPLLRRLRQSLDHDGLFEGATVSVLTADGTVRGRQVEDDRLVKVSYSEPAADLIPARDKAAPFSAGGADEEDRP